MAAPINDGLRELATPERNNFYYGKLMDVDQWRKDQRHFDLKRSLVNRLVLGHGVVCGLGVTATSEHGVVRIEPGAALDGWGREIVVPRSLTVDARQLTDDSGQPHGAPLTTGPVEVCLAYAEHPTDPSPVLVPDCDHAGGCASGTVREVFRILVRKAESAAPRPPGCPFDKLDSPLGESLHQKLAAAMAQLGSEAPADPSIPIARVEIGGGSVDIASGRRLVYGNHLLYELILCLASRIDALEHP